MKYPNKGYELKQFLDEVKSYNPGADLKMAEKAFIFARDAHRGQKRESGEPYFTHCVDVSRILMELNVDSATICAALLHDVLEDNKKITVEKLSQEFGKEVSDLVVSLTKLDKLQFGSREEYTAENIRKVLLASAKDIRVILIKLADRLHNMRTLKYTPEDKQKRVAKETLDVFAPIAEKLGIWPVKGELEDLSLRYLEPEIYDFLKQKIGEKREEREKKTKEIATFLQKELEKNGIQSKVFGRAKYFYSVYKKMQKKQKEFHEIFDLIGIRIVTMKEEDCYAALNLVHSLWPHRKTQYKDYIKYPKENGYQSLHTTVYGPYNKVLEIQIRTLSMHYEAEDGIAAHWRYAGTERDKLFDRRIQWIKQVLEWQRNAKNAKRFIESIKMDVYGNEIVALTPKGDPITLVDGATPLDFAYEVHTSIGNYYAGAKVNGKPVPMEYRLKSGDVVDVITSKTAHPTRSWLNIAVTNRAKSKIKHALGLSVGGRIIKSQRPAPDLAKEVVIKDPSIKGQIRIAHCCNPVVNEPIIGYRSKDDAILIHTIDCPYISVFDHTGSIDVHWKTKEKNLPFHQFNLKVQDRVGLLSEVLTVFSSMGANLDQVNSRVSKKHVYIQITIKRTTPQVLGKLAERIKATPGVVNLFVE